MTKTTAAAPMEPAARPPVADPTPVVPAGHALVLRTCTATMTGIHNHPKAKLFVWPEAGPVECTDWKPEAECGNGLHGLLWGEGDGSTLSWADDAKWLVVAVPEGTWVELHRKVKFPKGEVVFCGDRKGATDYLQTRAPGRTVVGATATAGHAGTATAGDGGILNISWWDGKRYRIATFYVGEDGIEPNQPYKVDEKGRPVRVEKKAGEVARG